MKNIRSIRNCQTKFVNLVEMNNFENLSFFRISHIIVKKLNFGFSIVFFQIKRKNIHLMKKCCGSLCSKQFCIITFFSYFV